MSVLVKTKELEQAGEKIIIQILEMGGEDHMIVADVAEMLNVPPGHVRKYIADHGLVVTKSSDHQLDTLKQQGVIPFKTTVANLLPQSTVQELVKIVNTPEAWAAYRALWNRPQEMVRAELDEIRAALEEMSLSHTQKVKAVDAMKKRYEELGLRFTDSIGQWPNGVAGSIRFILADIKNRFFDREHKYKFTWKDIPAKEFPLLMDHIETWNPSSAAMKQLLRCGYVKDPAK